MAELERHDGRRTTLHVLHEVGRSRHVQLRLESTTVSSLHACVRYAKGRWLLRDCGSRNGTWLNGERLGDTDHWRILREGDCVQFASSDERWWVVDDSPPSAAAIRGDLRIEAKNGLLILPSATEPEVCIVLRDGVWMMDRSGEWCPVENGQAVEVKGASFELSLPEPDVASIETTVPNHETLLEHFVFEFRASENEESIQITLVGERERIVLPERAFHYTLMVLARARAADARAGMDRWCAGWISREELLVKLGATAEVLNVNVHRARRQLAELGIDNAVDIVERRHGAAELRLGTDRFVVLRAGRDRVREEESLRDEVVPPARSGVRVAETG